MTHKKLLILTGGSRGIGRETNILFLKKDWRVINISRTQCDVAGVDNLILDLSKPEDIFDKKKSLQTLIGNETIISLVHNAGFYIKDNIECIQSEVIQTTLQVNVMSPAILNSIMLPYMNDFSSIIYVGSTLAEMAVPNSASYVISKHALKGLMKSTCQDLSHKKIHTCLVNPGLVDTKLLADTMPEKIIKSLVNEKIIGKRLIDPQEIAEIIYFAAISPIINGTAIDANLGQLNI